MYRRIRDLREDRDFTQRQMAQILSVSQATYSRYESGELDVPTVTLKKLAKIYGVTIDYILEVEE